jgi:hypothetical protein
MQKNMGLGSSSHSYISLRYAGKLSGSRFGHITLGRNDNCLVNRKLGDTRRGGGRTIFCPWKQLKHVVFNSTNVKLKIMDKKILPASSRNHRKHKNTGKFGNESNHNKDRYIGKHLVKK